LRPPYSFPLFSGCRRLPSRQTLSGQQQLPFPPDRNKARQQQPVIGALGLRYTNSMAQQPRIQQQKAV